MSSFDSILKSYEGSSGTAKKQKLVHDDTTDQSTKRDLTNLQLPQFLIIGAQKAGTMAAVKNLNKHPDIFVASEVHYFDLAWHTKDVKWYSSQLQSTKKIIGEKTPELIYVDECFERIKDVCPDSKFLLFLRDPVARAYSSWNMNVSKNREGATFDECIQRNLNNLDEFRSYGTGEFHYVQRGFYMDQIERFLKVFPKKENLMIVIAERIKSNPKAEYQRIFDFLGAKPFDFFPEDDHIGSYSAKLSSRVAERLRRVYRSHNERLFAFLGERIPEWDEAPAPLPSSTPADSALAPDSVVTPTSSTSSGTLPVDAATATAAAAAAATSKLLTFAELGRKHGTDKVTHHGYHRFYPRFIEQYRSGPSGQAMLEIGVDQSHSLNMWLEYYPHAFVYGVDISLSKSGERFRIFKADQGQLREMRHIVEKELQHPLFLIVDDGSHIPEHQVQCFDYLFGSSALLPGGTYIVEDIETSYWTRGGLYGYTTR